MAESASLRLRVGRLGRGHGASTAVVDQVVVSALNFAFVLVVGRYLEPSVFGALAIFGTTLLLAMLVHSSVVITPMTLEASNLAEVARDSIRLHVVVTLGLTLFTFAGSYVVSEPTLVGPIRLSVLAIPFVLTGEFLPRGEMARVNWKTVLWSDSIGLGLRLGALVVLCRLIDKASAKPRPGPPLS